MTEDELMALIETDPIKALCHVVKEVGGVMTLYGKPVTEEELRASLEESVEARLSALLGTGQGKEPDRG